MNRTPASMEYVPAIETTKLYGKKMLEYTKKELAALIIWLFEKHEKDTKEHHRQLRFITSLRK